MITEGAENTEFFNAEITGITEDRDCGRPASAGHGMRRDRDHKRLAHAGVVIAVVPHPAAQSAAAAVLCVLCGLCVEIRDTRSQ